MNLFEKILAFNQKHRVVSHVLFWLLLMFFQFGSANYFNSNSVPFVDKLLAVGTNMMAEIPAAYFLTYFIIPRFVYRQKYFGALCWFAVSVYIICVLSRLEVVHIEEPYYNVKPNPKETYIEIFTDLRKLIYVYFFRIFSVAFVFMLVKLLKDQLGIQRRTLSLEKQKAEAELKMLKAQLNPHFLFNTLNNIYSLVLANSSVTAGAIGRLSEILDYILYRCEGRYVPLSGEITLLRNYIELEKLRYDERLTVRLTCEAEDTVEIAPLILLSIVENAFKHGAGGDIGRPVMDIGLKADHRSIAFTVANSFQAKATVNQVNIGLPNLKQQLELLYPGKHRLILTETENLFTVKLNIDPS